MERKEAAERGLKKYNTGRLCKNGHGSDRYTATGACESCIRGYQQQYIKAVKLASVYGLADYSARVHPDDFAALDAYVAALEMDRRAKRDAQLEADARLRMASLVEVEKEAIHVSRKKAGWTGDNDDWSTK